MSKILKIAKRNFKKKIVKNLIYFNSNSYNMCKKWGGARMKRLSSITFQAFHTHETG